MQILWLTWIMYEWSMYRHLMRYMDKRDTFVCYGTLCLKHSVCNMAMHVCVKRIMIVKRSWKYVCLWAYKKVHVSKGNCVAIQIRKEILMCTCECIWLARMSDNCSTCYVRTEIWNMKTGKEIMCMDIVNGKLYNGLCPYIISI